jgi:hypothetical protein
MYIQLSCHTLAPVLGWRTVTQMETTTIEDDMTRVLARYARCTHTMTAEHHPDDHGMHYVLHIEGGQFSGTVIHCSTEDSVMRLFNELVAAHKSGVTHPYLAAL